MAAKRDFLNLLARDKRRAQKENSTTFVDIEDESQEHEIDIPAGVDIEQDFIDSESSTLDRLNAMFPDPRDREIAGMMVDAIRETEPYAKVLEISHLSPEDQAREVKRHKDRIKKRIQRSGIKRELLPND